MLNYASAFTLDQALAGGLGIRTRVTRRSQAQPGDPGRLDTSEFFEQACWHMIMPQGSFCLALQ